MSESSGRGALDEPASGTTRTHDGGSGRVSRHGTKSKEPWLLRLCAGNLPRKTFRLVGSCFYDLRLLQKNGNTSISTRLLNKASRFIQGSDALAGG